MMFLDETEVVEVDHKTALINDKHRLQRLFRIKEIQRLEAHRRTLKKFLIQRYEIAILLHQLYELKADEANILCKQNAIKDTHCKNSLSYLLDVQAKHRKDIEDLELQRKTLKNELIAESDSGNLFNPIDSITSIGKDRLWKLWNELLFLIEAAYRELCAKRNDYARVVRKKKPKMPMQKQLTMYECRLEHERQAYGGLLYKNSNLRYEINHLLIVRSTYEQHYRRCHELFEESIKIMREHLNTTNMAYHSRGEYRMKILLLRDRYEGDMAKLYANQQLLHRLIEKEAISDEISAIKEKFREDAKAVALQQMVDEGITGLEEQLEKSQHIFNEIRETSELEDTEAMKVAFSSIEDENFTVFTYVNKVHQETDALELHVRDLRAKIRGIEDNLAVQQKEYRQQIKRAQRKLEVVQEEVGVLQGDEEGANSELEAVIGIMRQLFSLCGCTDSHVLNGLGAQNLDNESAAEYVEILEKYVVDMLLAYEYLKFKELGEQEPETEDLDNISLLSAAPSFRISSRDPRHLDSANVKATKRLETSNDFLSFEDLHIVASQAVASSSESLRSSGSSSTD